MENYSIYLLSEKAKCNLVAIVASVGAQLVKVSTCGNGFHISLEATVPQASKINAMFALV